MQVFIYKFKSKLVIGVALATLLIQPVLADNSNSHNNNCKSSKKNSSASSYQAFLPIESAIIELFKSGELAEEPTVEDCTLINGEVISCYSIMVLGTPVDHAENPYCPVNSNGQRKTFYGGVEAAVGRRATAGNRADLDKV